MGNRLAQVSLLILGLAFAFAALDAFSEPWRTMNQALIAKTIAGHFAGLVLSIVCFRAALFFGVRAAYGSSKRLREPQL